MPANRHNLCHSPQTAGGKGLFRGPYAYAHRINQTRYCAHFDAIRLLPSPEENATTEIIRRLRQGEVFRDPFALPLFLGYVSTFQDYALVSVGPDGDADLLGFVQRASGEYSVERREVPAESFAQEVERRGRSLISDQDGRNHSASLVIDVNALYDPTNGLVSNGDVVFHRRGGDDLLFSFEGFRLLQARGFVKRDVEALFERSVDKPD
jgi:hypothetical protein